MMTIKLKHLVVILALVALFSMLVMVRENIEYISIAAERSSVASSVSAGKVDFDTLECEYQRCIERMNALEEKSDYGYMLASIDKMGAGKLVIGVLMFIQLMVSLVASFMISAYIVCTVIRIAKKLQRRIRRARARRKREAARKAATKKTTIKARPVVRDVV